MEMNMRLICSLASLALLVTLAAGTADAGKGNKKNKGNHVHGVVSSIDDNTLIVKAKHKKGEAPTEEKFKIGKETKVEKISGKKGDIQVAPGTLADLKAGSHVAIVAKDGAAEVVKIREKKGKKNKAAA
jgi:hypothetical protein